MKLRFSGSIHRRALALAAFAGSSALASLAAWASPVAWPAPTGPAKVYFDSIWEPRVVAVPLGDSGPGAIAVLPDGEIVNRGARL
ncbi:MAG: hypothetical protein PUJ80_10460, partial [Verrucomicrobiota bacterium]|nr:hypothetical protein [Verrucomicrobiota bacterium]